MAATCRLTLATLNHLCVELKGLPIGGNLSNGGVSVRLSAQESRFLTDSPAVLSRLAALNFVFPLSRSSHISWIRYVDDLLAASRAPCTSCIHIYLQVCFSEKLSPESPKPNISHPSFKSLEWADAERFITGQRLVARLKNPNRPWLYEPLACPVRPKPSFVPWYCTNPSSSAALQSILTGRFVRSINLDTYVITPVFAMLEVIVELSIIGFPKLLLLALIDKLPPVAHARAARGILRHWLKRHAAMTTRHTHARDQEQA